MNKYHKIETLFERDEQFAVMTDKLKNPVIGTINAWRVTEKIDGTNIRIHLSAENEVQVGGRTDNAQLHADLLRYLFETFTAERLATIRKGVDPVSITLYGEGYGAGIQKGGGDYRPDKGFILFDVLIDGRWWLDDDAVTEIAAKLNVPRVPILGVMTLPEIVSMVKTGFMSTACQTARMAEGVVARPLMPLFDHRGKRIILKLKTKDFTAGSRQKQGAD